MTTRKTFFKMPLHKYQNNKNRQQLIANKKKYIEQNNTKNNSRNMHSPSYSYTTFGPNYVYIPNDNNKQNQEKPNQEKPNPKKSNNLWILIATIGGVYLSIRKNR